MRKERGSRSETEGVSEKVQRHRARRRKEELKWGTID